MESFGLKRLSRLKGEPPEGRRKKGKWILLSGVFILSLSILAFYFIFPSKPTPPTASPSLPAPPSPPEEPQHQTIAGDVKERSTLYKSLAERNIPLPWIDLILSKLKPYVNFKKIRGGVYQLITDAKGELVKFIYEAGPTEIYEIERDSGGYTVRQKPVTLETYLVKVVGEIRSSLFEAMEAAGERDALTIDFAEILAWEIDFYKDVREGDRFKLVMEKIYKGDQFIRYGTIRAVEYRRGEKIIRGIRYKDGYYNDQGISLRKAFLKAPLRFNRISSRFSQARRHPILGGVRPHYGIDYAAPSGTPIWAVADGVVVSCGWNSGFGKQVILRHMNGYRTHYGHLSAYGSGIKQRKTVRQKQIIGYVGSTGLSTGPHLDYRLTKEGRFRNPIKETFPTGVPIGKGEKEIFQQRKGEMVGWLEGEDPFRRRVDEEGRLLQ